MIRDIEFPNIEGVKMAIALNTDENENQDWYVYLINTNGLPLENVMVVSKGYAQSLYEDRRETSILRHHFTKLPAESNTVIEKLDEEVFGLCNEFWLSYYYKGKLYDKRYVFLPGSITETNIINIKELGLTGVVHS